MSLASIISGLFEPMVVFYILTVLGTLKAGLTGDHFTIFLSTVTFILFLPILVFRFWLVKTKRVVNWDVTNRKQRIIPLAVLVALSLITGIVTNRLGNAFLSELFIFYFLWLVGFFLVTLRFKLSGHVGIVTLAVGLIISWYGIIALPALVAVPLVAWSRIQLKAHTKSQVVVGALYSCVMVFLFVFVHYPVS